MEQELLERIADFICAVGITVRYASLEPGTFLPGVDIREGSIIVDRQQLKYPGDLLHEAGHIASVPPGERATLDAVSIGLRKDRAAEEMMAIAWSYAACRHLGIDPAYVFHEEGYQGGGPQIAREFEAGRYFGVPMLQWAGMTTEPRQATGAADAVYPAMRCWLRQQ